MRCFATIAGEDVLLDSAHPGTYGVRYVTDRQPGQSVEVRCECGAPIHAAATVGGIGGLYPCVYCGDCGAEWPITLVEAGDSVPWVEVDRETAYGSTVRLSRSVRVF